MAFEQVKTFVFGCQRRQCIIGSWRSSQRSTDDRFWIHQSNRRNSTETTKNQAQFISFLRQFQVFIYLFEDFLWNFIIFFLKIHSSSRSDSWRLGHVPPGMIIKPRHHHHHHHKRRNSWTVTRKPSQDSQMSSSR